jgi:hypothetical protein
LYKTCLIPVAIRPELIEDLYKQLYVLIQFSQTFDADGDGGRHYRPYVLQKYSSKSDIHQLKRSFSILGFPSVGLMEKNSDQSMPKIVSGLMHCIRKSALSTALLISGTECIFR